MHESVEELIPHRQPMVMIDRLVECSAEAATAVKTFRSGDYGLGDDGRVAEPALIECLAQTAAAMHGANRDPRDSARHEGMLVGVDGFEFLRPVRRDEPLVLTVHVTHRVGAFCLLEGHARSGPATVATGGLKLYIAAHVPDDHQVPPTEGRLP